MAKTPKRKPSIRRFSCEGEEETFGSLYMSFQALADTQRRGGGGGGGKEYKTLNKGTHTWNTNYQRSKLKPRKLFPTIQLLFSLLAWPVSTRGSH